MADLVQHPIGVHLRQRHDEYLEDCGIGYGGAKDLFLDPIEWWHDSPYNPMRKPPPPDTQAQARGEAFHVRCLLGEKMYDRVYGVRPTRESHPGYLDTIEDLRGALARHGLDDRYAVKDTLISRLVAGHANENILAVEQARFDRSGKKQVTEDDDARIRILHRMIQRSPQELKLPDGEHMTLAQAFDKALTEVSIYWVTEDGIRKRARFDMLKPNFSGDLKGIARWRRGNFKVDLLSEIILRGYMIQVVHYDEARRELRKAVAEGRVFGGTKTERKLLERVARAEEWGWLFVFGKMEGAPQVKGIVLHRGMAQWIKAQQQYDEAMTNFVFHRTFHGGLDQAWFDPDVIYEPEDTDWPAFSVLGGGV